MMGETGVRVRVKELPLTLILSLKGRGNYFNLLSLDGRDKSEGES
jgi:hypothetical protein